MAFLTRLQTRISTTYSHRALKKRKSPASANLETTDSSVAQSQTAVAIVKVFDPVSGVCLKVRINRVNELNRVWTALGPRGVDIDNTRVKGLAAVISNIESSLESPETEQLQNLSAPSTGKKKNKKR